MPTDPNAKTCSRCKEQKTISDFSRSSKQKSGRRPECKVCSYIAEKARRAKDPNWASKRAASDRRTKENNRDIVAARKKRWVEKNPDIIAAQQKRWRELNRDKIRFNNMVNHAKRRSNGAYNSVTLIPMLLEKQNFRCAVCKEKLDLSRSRKVHLDHIVPIKLGGLNDKTNLQLLCQTCNCSKGCKHPLDFMRQRGFLL